MCFQLRKHSKEVWLHTPVHPLTELYQLQAGFIPQGGDWRWLPNEDVFGSDGKLLGVKM
jgi:hypothetical protein